MSSTPLTPSIEETPAPLQEHEIRRRIASCPKLASLEINRKALNELANSEQSLTSQIAEIIRRDPSLSARLLRMVNSVYFGLSARANSIEDAVFFLGLRQIRELSLATPVIEELEQLQGGVTAPLPWKDLWAHSIGTAVLTREILRATPVTIDDDTDYLIGLLHDVGKVVMAYAFPEQLEIVRRTEVPTPADVCTLERQIIGWDHAQIGAHYLQNHRVAEEIVFGVRYHSDPARAPRHRLFAAAAQLADHLVRHSGMNGGFESVAPVQANSWLELDGWRMLYGADGPESAIALAAIQNALQRLPTTLNGLVDHHADHS